MYVLSSGVASSALTRLARPWLAWLLLRSTQSTKPDSLVALHHLTSHLTHLEVAKHIQQQQFMAQTMKHPKDAHWFIINLKSTWSTWLCICYPARCPTSEITKPDNKAVAKQLPEPWVAGCLVRSDNNSHLAAPGMNDIDSSWRRSQSN